METQEARRYFAAFSRAYNVAMRVIAIRISGEGLFAVASGIAAWTGAHGLSWLGLVSGVWLILRRLLLDPLEQRRHRQGVKLQEDFDTRVFALAWNEGLAGDRLTRSDVECYANAFKGNRAEADKWFVNTAETPHWIGVLIRQWQTAAWAKKDHLRFSVIIGSIVIVILALTVTIAVSTDLTMDQYLATLALPALPVILSLMEMQRRHREQAIQREKAERAVESVLDRARALGAAEAAERDARRIQDALFLSRYLGGRIPTQFYRLFRKKNERDITAAAREMVEEFKKPVPD